MSNSIWGDGRSETLIYRVRLELRDAFTNDVDVLSLACIPHADEDLQADLRDYYLLNTAPAALVVLTASPLAKDARRLMRNKHVLSALPRRLTAHGSPDSPVIVALEADGSASGMDALHIQLADPSVIDSAGLFHWILAAGLSRVLHESDAIHRGSASFHYRTPSGSHQQDFVVVGEAFHNSARAGFAALAVWAHLGGGMVNQVLVDSSTLAAVGFSVSALARLYNSTRPTPGVRSFRGHRATRSQIADWAANSGAVFVISASASGTLSRSIQAAAGDPARAVSLFFLGESGDAPPATVCDLRAHPGLGEQTVKLVPANIEPCTHCEEGSAVIEISGDSFFPATPHTIPRRVVMADRPEWISTTGEQLFARQLFSLHRRVGGGGTRLVHFDLGRALVDDYATETLRNKLVQPHSGSPSPDLVVHANDSDSRALAEWWIGERELSGVDILSQEDLRSAGTRNVEYIAVFCSVVASGRSANEISRALRVVAPKAKISYHCGMVRTWTDRRWNDLSSDLKVGPGGSSTHNVLVAFSAPMPPDHELLIDPWGYERTVWEQVVEVAETAGFADSIDGRLAALSAGSLIEDAFLPKSSAGLASSGADDRLRLTQNFAFWGPGWNLSQGFDYGCASQADLFVTLCTMLNKARTEVVKVKNVPLPLLSVDAHNRVVVDPFAFNRFTDGVLQAALLRAAMSRELDYSSSRQLSRDMATVVKRIIESSETPDGDASLEFILALAGGHMRLRDDDLASVVATAKAVAARQDEETGSLLRLLAQFVESRGQFTALTIPH